LSIFVRAKKMTPGQERGTLRRAILGALSPAAHPLTGGS